MNRIKAEELFALLNQATAIRTIGEEAIFQHELRAKFSENMQGRLFIPRDVLHFLKSRFNDKQRLEIREYLLKNNLGGRCPL